MGRARDPNELRALPATTVQTRASEMRVSAGLMATFGSLAGFGPSAESVDWSQRVEVAARSLPGSGGAEDEDFETYAVVERVVQGWGSCGGRSVPERAVMERNVREVLEEASARSSGFVMRVERVQGGESWRLRSARDAGGGGEVREASSGARGDAARGLFSSASSDARESPAPTGWMRGKLYKKLPFFSSLFPGSKSPSLPDEFASLDEDGHGAGSVGDGQQSPDSSEFGRRPRFNALPEDGDTDEEEEDEQKLVKTKCAVQEEVVEEDACSKVVDVEEVVEEEVVEEEVVEEEVSEEEEGDEEEVNEEEGGEEEVFEDVEEEEEILQDENGAPGSPGASEMEVDVAIGPDAESEAKGSTSTGHLEPTLRSDSPDDEVVLIETEKEEEGEAGVEGVAKTGVRRPRSRSALTLPPRRRRAHKRRRKRPSIWDDDKTVQVDGANDAEEVVVDVEEDCGDIVEMGGDGELVIARKDDYAPRWLDTAVAAWMEISDAMPGRSMILLSELQNHAYRNWDRLCWVHTKHVRWDWMIRRVICDGQGKQRPFDAEDAGCDWEVRLLPAYSEVVANLHFVSESVAMQGLERRDRRQQGKPALNILRRLRSKRSAPKARNGGSAEKSIENEVESIEEKTDPEVDADGNDSTDCAGVVSRVLPSPLVDSIWWRKPSGAVALCSFDKAIGLSLHDNPNGAKNVVVRGHKGFRSIRATHGVVEGSWYFEVTVRSFDGDGAVRIGWATRCADIAIPVGAAGSGFGIRDRGGEFICNSLLSTYGESFGIGDVIGCSISLPDDLSPSRKRNIAERDTHWLNYRFAGWMPPAHDPDAHFEEASVAFFKNGRSLGVPIEFSKRNTKRVLVPEGTYYPMLSMYKNAVASVNFGPFSAIPPGCRPMSDLGDSDENFTMEAASDEAAVDRVANKSADEVEAARGTAAGDGADEGRAAEDDAAETMAPRMLPDL